jgi:hypothetical protein
VEACTVTAMHKVGVLVRGEGTQFTVTSFQFTKSAEVAGVGVKGGAMILDGCIVSENNSSNIEKTASRSAQAQGHKSSKTASAEMARLTSTICKASSGSL